MLKAYQGGQASKLSYFDVEIFLSNKLPEPNKISGKYNHIYKDLGVR